MEHLILGIETSCDETAAALVDARGRIHANQIFSQISAHQPHGGVVPEIAARAHSDRISDVIKAAFDAAGATPKDITAIAATEGLGLSAVCWWVR